MHSGLHYIINPYKGTNLMTMPPKCFSLARYFFFIFSLFSLQNILCFHGYVQDKGTIVLVMHVNHLPNSPALVGTGKNNVKALSVLPVENCTPSPEWRKMIFMRVSLLSVLELPQLFTDAVVSHVHKLAVVTGLC